MKPEKKISLLFLCVAMLIIAGCRKDDTPAEVKTPVGFRARSQVVWVKSGSTSSLPSTIQKFIAWGVAGNALNIQYIWNRDTFIDVDRQTDGSYKTDMEGYWFANSAHDFLALASDPSTIALPAAVIYHKVSSTQLDPSMKFTYDWKSRYAAKEYSHDLLAAAAHKDVGTVIPSSQDLVFWHIFSKINMTLKFVDSDKETPLSPENASLTRIRLCNVKTKADYTISYGTDEHKLDLECDFSKYSNKDDQTNYSTPAELIFTNQVQTFYILPQNISDFRMYLDFTMKLDGEDVEFRDCEINLFPNETVPLEYNYNNQYNWNIFISKKNIKFEVSVIEWQDGGNVGEAEII